MENVVKSWLKSQSYQKHERANANGSERDAGKHWIKDLFEVEAHFLNRENIFSSLLRTQSITRKKWAKINDHVNNIAYN